MTYQLCIGLALGSSQTGLTLKAQLIDTAGASVGSEVTSGFVEIGAGLYTWNYASFPDGHRGAVKFYTAGPVYKAIYSINPEEAENTDAKTSSRTKPADTQARVTLVDTVTTYTGNTPQTGDNFARLGAPVGASIAADIAGVQADTDNLQTRIPTALVSGRIDASVGAMAANVVTAAAMADAALDRATFAADTGMQSARSNTAQSGAAGTITLDASASAVTDFYVGLWIFLTGGTGVGQARVCTAYNGSTKVATIAPNWATNPDNTSTFAILHAAQLTGIQGALTGSVGSVTGAVGSVTGNVGGNVVGSVGSLTTNNDKTGYTLSAAGIQAVWDALTSALTTVGSIGKRIVDFLTGDAFARIGAAGAGLTALGDTRIANLDATVSSRTKPADTQARVTLVDTVTTYTGNTPQTGDNYARLGAPAGASISADIAAVKVDTAAIKVQTNKLTFTVANQIDANVLDWKSATAPAMTGDAFARLGAPAGASIAADLAEIEAETDDIALVKAKTDNLPAVPAAAGDAMALTSGERNSVADALLDRANAVETGLTVRQAFRLALAALAGKLSGGGTTTITIRNAVADSKDRITATVDANDNRTAITTDVS